MDDRSLEPTPQPGPKRLYRSMDQKWLLGVCGGLAEYFDIDPMVVRAVFAISTLLFGTGVLLYVVLALIMPKEEDLTIHPREAARHTLDDVGSEIERGVNTVVDKVKEMTARKPGAASTGTTGATTATTAATAATAAGAASAGTSGSGSDQQQWDGTTASGTMWTPSAAAEPATAPDAPTEQIPTAWETTPGSTLADEVLDERAGETGGHDGAGNNSGAPTG